MASHSSILAWEIHGTRSLVGCGPWDSKNWTQLSDKPPPPPEYITDALLAQETVLLSACRTIG